ncbi:MAG: hypothetical protein Q7K54_06410 [Candidatus Parcubacteria bacterium]|nr:hypothetical protein [Candidatus Parcubacteria bacterium]
MEKIKHFIESDKGKDILIVLIVILVGLGSFELGRLSKESADEGIKIKYSDQNQENAENSILLENSDNSSKTANIISTTNLNSAEKNFFASNRGSKYYSLGCSAGKNIKQENRIYFATGEEAQKAGYALSSACR